MKVDMYSQVDMGEAAFAQHAHQVIMPYLFPNIINHLRCIPQYICESATYVQRI